jgi:hypothetical protein
LHLATDNTTIVKHLFLCGYLILFESCEEKAHRPSVDALAPVLPFENI